MIDSESLGEAAWRRFLPPPPARLLVMGRRGEAEALAGEGYGVASLAEASAEPFEGALVWADGLEAAERLCRRLRPLLTAEGVAVVVGFRPGNRPAVEAALAEAGFLLRRRVVEAAGWLLVALPDAWRVRAFRGGEEAAIADLFERSFLHRRELDHWSWQYRRNPEGGPRVCLAVSTEDHRIVAHYAGYPVRFQRKVSDKAEALIAHQIGDTMTLAEVRHVGRGPTSLLARCGRYFYARFCEGQVAFNYGFNVGNIQKFSMLFLDAQRVEDVPFWRLDLTSGAACVGRQRRSWLRSYEAVGVSRLDESWDRLLEEVSPAYGMMVRRDRRYLEWRYLERPGFDYFLVAATLAGAFRRRRLVGWGVFRRAGQCLLWGDLLLHPEHPKAAHALLEAALEHPTAAGALRVEGWFAPRPPWIANVLTDLGFESRNDPQDLALMCVPFETPDAPEILRREFYYTLGDGDLF